MPSITPSFQPSPADFASAGALSQSVRTTGSKHYPDGYYAQIGESHLGPNRRSRFEVGEEKLRSHLPKDAPLKLTCYWNAMPAPGQWLVRTLLLLEGHEPLDLGIEPLDVFPSDELIATAILVA